jgi:uncharacterized protein YaiI (UPF0178 family)
VATIWTDADACPVQIREILFRAAERTRTALVLVANQPIRAPRSELIRTLQVPKGFDVADNEIVRRMSAGDLVVTADIPLAAAAIDRGGVALNPRGDFYTAENVKQRLAMRNLMTELRDTGRIGGGPPALNARDRQSFANALDRWLARTAAP